MLPPDLVLVARVGSADVAPHPVGCPLRTFDEMPATVLRDLGSIELAGSVPVGSDILAAVDQKACESGADAIVITKQEERKLVDRIEYHVIAEAIITHPQTGVPSPESTPAPAESAEAPDAAESAAAVAAPAATPKEILMQPVGADATNLEDTGAAQRSNAMTESSIAATEAAPLAPAIAPSTAIAPATRAAPVPISSSLARTTATPSATPTSRATAVPEATATPTPTPTVAITPTVTPSAESTATATSTATPTLTPEATVTTTPTPTVTLAVTPTDTLTYTATPSPALEDAATTLTATPSASGPSPAASGD